MCSACIYRVCRTARHLHIAIGDARPAVARHIPDIVRIRICAARLGYRAAVQRARGDTCIEIDFIFLRYVPRLIGRTEIVPPVRTRQTRAGRITYPCRGSRFFDFVFRYAARIRRRVFDGTVRVSAVCDRRTARVGHLSRRSDRIEIHIDSIACLPFYIGSIKIPFAVVRIRGRDRIRIVIRRRITARIRTFIFYTAEILVHSRINDLLVGIRTARNKVAAGFHCTGRDTFIHLELERIEVVSEIDQKTRCISARVLQFVHPVRERAGKQCLIPAAG